MSTGIHHSDPSAAASETEPATHGKLARNAIGPLGVIFMVVATAAPITAMTGNTPYIIGFGVGEHAPGIFLIVTIILSIFSIGYVRLARHITTTGAFYGYVSHGLGQVLGLASGVLALFAYLIFEVAIAGAFSYFAQVGLGQLGIDIEWIWLAFALLVLNSVLACFKITIGTAVLGVFLILEIAILAVSAIGGLANPGPDGYMLSSLNPLGALQAIQGGTVGLALFLGFWSWVGFESTAIYGEESRNPRRTVPIATFISVIGIGLFYTFVSWAAVVTSGGEGAIALAQSENATDVFLVPAAANLGEWAVPTFLILMVSGSFACALAFHNSASRYLYALGRDQISRVLTPLGKTHAKHESPYLASIAQSVIAAVLVSLLYFTGINAYDTFVLIGLMGTLSILIVQVLASLAVVGYFTKHHIHERHWFATYVAPILSAIAMICVIGLLLINKEDAAGESAASSWLFPAIPWIVAVIFVSTIVWGLYLKSSAPSTFERIGKLVLEPEKD